EEIWFDPAAGPFTFGDIPLGDQGVSAMLIGEEANGRFIEIPEDDPKRQCIRRHFHGSLSADGEHEYRADSSVCGERAAFYRIMLRDRNEDHRRRLVQQSVADERPGATVDEVVIGDLGDLDTPVTYSYRVRLRRWARQIDDLLVFRIPW